MARIEQRGLGFYLNGVRLTDGDVIALALPSADSSTLSVVKLEAARLRFFVQSSQELGGAVELELDLGADIFGWPALSGDEQSA
jgi:hypothetical protein